MKTDHEKYMQCGLNSYVLKPFKEDDLIRAIVKQLDNKQDDMNTIPEQETEIKNDESLYNLSQLTEISRGDEDFITKMIGIFISQAHIFIEEIAESTKCNDLPKIALVHKFKPSVGNICHPFMYSDIKQVEQIALKGETSDELVIVSNRFLKNLNEVIIQLQAKVPAEV